MGWRHWKKAEQKTALSQSSRSHPLDEIGWLYEALLKNRRIRAVAILPTIMGKSCMTSIVTMSANHERVLWVF